MTLMLASVANSLEADAVWEGGADIVDLKDPAKGALGALDTSIVAEVVRAAAKRRLVSATAGDSFASAQAAVDAVARMASTGVDYVKLGFASGTSGADCIRALGGLAKEVKLIGVLFADREPDLDALRLMAGQGFAGAMLDTATKGLGRLLDYMDVAALVEFVDQCREVGLISGLAGSLEAPDVPRLLPLQPNYLGFRGALCHGRLRGASIDAASVSMIRDLIPRRGDGGTVSGEASVDWRLLMARGQAAPVERAIETDRVFVHDLIMPCSIGAYDFERGVKQNVRFNIDVDVKRAQRHSDDMRDIFSYDLVVDAIKILLGRGHVELIETLARDLADSVLGHPQVVRVCVRIEKLDVICGMVGVEIKRERAMESGAVDQLFPSLGGGAGNTRSH
ncbi:(5-formylfuran-3-yl)methyl phosphate synthase [Methylocapsa acidiphila]|uniref:(5-formylfuran-3-yl)methyl phosphate synthase n=1 Tax=Methylocapsa acidiphila TaxID=133552 RepID=UPI000688E77E|nr:(5-formylfuran-3-yl)methyl phosphate synthase [Methylocapsa acidiphila]